MLNIYSRIDVTLTSKEPVQKLQEAQDLPGSVSNKDDDETPQVSIYSRII